MTKRKFYRTVYSVEILSETPMEDGMSLDNIHWAMTEGDCSGRFLPTTFEEVDGKAMAELLQKQGSDPEFFMLTEAGDDLEEEE